MTPDQARVMTVLGPVPVDNLGVTDAHTHVWIVPPPGLPPGLPRLDDEAAIIAELQDYRRSGGGALVDCQPGGCGRDGNRLRAIVQTSRVHIIASTGFHLRKYYPPDFWLYQSDVDADAVRAWFVDELTRGLDETLEAETPVRAGFIKIACEARLEETPAALIEAAAAAGAETGSAIEVHTERGADAERIVIRFQQLGFPLDKLVICHVDKRPDFGLHQDLAMAGVMLEYDTFYRPKYHPEKHVWPLLAQMADAGLADHIALATDMAEASMWTRLGGSPGLTAFMGRIRPRLRAMGLASETIRGLMGGNIARVLARPAGYDASMD
jgi:phosphotriesterase-related protein